MKTSSIYSLISQFRSESDAQFHSDFLLQDNGVLVQTGRELMSAVPPAFGHCLLLSATWAKLLREKYSVPAVVVAGGLEVGGRCVFSGAEPIPDGESSGHQNLDDWNGHCWIDVGGYIGDISIFRTAYSFPKNHLLHSFVSSTFGEGKGLMLATYTEAFDTGFQYTPRFILTDAQVDGLFAGLGHLLHS